MNMLHGKWRGIRKGMEMVEEENDGRKGLLVINVSELPLEEYFKWFQTDRFRKTETFRRFGAPSSWEVWDATHI